MVCFFLAHSVLQVSRVTELGVDDAAEFLRRIPQQEQGAWLFLAV